MPLPRDLPEIPAEIIKQFRAWDHDVHKTRPAAEETIRPGDCGHRCCSRRFGRHDHFLTADECPHCEGWSLSIDALVKMRRSERGETLQAAAEIDRLRTALDDAALTRDERMILTAYREAVAERREIRLSDDEYGDDQ